MEIRGHKPHSLEYMPIVIGENVMHYTCNAPSQKILDKNDIGSLGDKFGCASPREVLRIPKKLYLKNGLTEFGDRNILQLNSENLMKRLN